LDKLPNNTVYLTDALDNLLNSTPFSGECQGNLLNFFKNKLQATDGSMSRVDSLKSERKQGHKERSSPLLAKLPACTKKMPLPLAVFSFLF